MCAAKLERTGFALRHVWPNVKQPSQTFAQEQSGAFIRKSSGKSEGSRARCSSAAKAPAPAPPKPQPCSSLPARGNALRHQRARLGAGPRHVATDFLRAQASFKQARSVSSTAATVQEPRFDPALTEVIPSVDHKDDRSRSGISIDELMQIASDKYKLNTSFWGKYQDIPSMAHATDKVEILEIIDNFALIHRKHVYLFQRLKNAVMKNLPLWSAPDLAALCHSWAQLGFLHEDLCIAMSERVTATAHACNAQELCFLMDAYATARCSVRSVTEEITAQTLITLDDFTVQQLCLHASSFARLNIHNEELFKAMASRLVQRSEESALGHSSQDQQFSARDLTLAAYSFAKLGFIFPELFSTIALKAQEVIRDFTARDLQMLIVAFARAQYHNSDLLVAVSAQAQRRMAQFSAESLTLMLRSLAFFDQRDSGLFTRALAQLPRMILTFRPADVTTLLSSFAAVQVHSEVLFHVVTPYILEKASVFTPSDWMSALHSYSSLGHQDMMFLNAMKLHLEASRLTLRQLATAIVDCSRLSFMGHSESLAEAAAAKLEDEAEGKSACSAEVAGQMYAALLLLGHSLPQHAPLANGLPTSTLLAEPPGLPLPTLADWGVPPGLSLPTVAAPPGLTLPSPVADSSALPGLLNDLARRLSSSAYETLSPATRLSLCYAMLLAPPVQLPCSSDDIMYIPSHPFATPDLVQRSLAEAETLAAGERHMLRQILQAQELVPWNRHAGQSSSTTAALALELETDSSGPPAPFFRSAWNHLAPLVPNLVDITPTPAVEGNEPSPALRGSMWRGIFVAQEIHRALEEMSLALSAVGVENQLVTNSDTEVHLLLPELAVHSRIADSRVGAGARKIALLWGSSVHYVAGADENPPEEAIPRLSLSAKFQVTLLRAAADAEVVVVPHWWWRNSDGMQASGHRLAAFLAGGGELFSAPHMPSMMAAARPGAINCVE